MYNNREYVPTHVSGTTGTQIFTGKGVLHNIVVNATTATAFGVFDEASNIFSGTMAILKASVAENSYNYDATVANGLYVTCGINGDYTVLWSKP